MRILMIIDGLPGGGAEKVVLTLAHGMVQSGHDVTLFSLRDVCHYTLPTGIYYQVIPDTCRTVWRKLTELSRRAQQLDDAVQQIQNEKGAFDLVFSHLHKTDRIVSRSRVLDPQRVWFCLHGMFSSSYLGARTGFARWFKRYKISRVYQQRNIVAVSRAVGDDLVQEFAVTPRRLAVIYNPFDIKEIHQLADQPCDLELQDFVLHVGRLHPNKRHDRLIKAYAISQITAPLVILGQGKEGDFERLRTLATQLGISERVILKGFQSNPYSYIKRARLLVLSSDSEGFGNVLVEALLCNTAVVSTRCPGGPSEILIGELARGLSELNEQSLGKTMSEIYHAPPINPQQLEQYSIEVATEKYLALLQPDE